MILKPPYFVSDLTVSTEFRPKSTNHELWQELARAYNQKSVEKEEAELAFSSVPDKGINHSPPFCPTEGARNELPERNLLHLHLVA